MENSTTNGMRIKYVEAKQDVQMLESILKQLETLTSQIEILTEYLKKGEK